MCIRKWINKQLKGLDFNFDDFDFEAWEESPKPKGKKFFNRNHVDYQKVLVSDDQ